MNKILPIIFFLLGCHQLDATDLAGRVLLKLHQIENIFLNEKMQPPQPTKKVASPTMIPQSVYQQPTLPPQSSFVQNGAMQSAKLKNTYVTDGVYRSLCISPSGRRNVIIIERGTHSSFYLSSKKEYMNSVSIANIDAVVEFAFFPHEDCLVFVCRDSLGRRNLCAINMSYNLQKRNLSRKTINITPIPDPLFVSAKTGSKNGSVIVYSGNGRKYFVHQIIMQTLQIQKLSESNMQIPFESATTLLQKMVMPNDISIINSQLRSGWKLSGATPDGNILCCVCPKDNAGWLYDKRTRVFEQCLANSGPKVLF